MFSSGGQWVGKPGGYPKSICAGISASVVGKGDDLTLRFLLQDGIDLGVCSELVRTVWLDKAGQMQTDEFDVRIPAHHLCCRDDLDHKTSV